MEHDRQLALKAEAEKASARKKMLQLQRGDLHDQMREREELHREVWKEWVHMPVLYPFRCFAGASFVSLVFTH